MEQPSAGAGPVARNRFRPLAARCVIYAAAAYLLLCLLLFLFQRSLIYPGTREPSITPERAGYPAGRARDVRLQTADGETLGMWHVRPKADFGAEFDAGLRAAQRVILFFHGNGGHRGHRAGLYPLLADMGAHVVAVDYRGYGDSTGAPGEAGLAEDARAAWQWLVKEHGLAPERIVLHGESLGCAVAVRLAQEQCAAGTPPAALVLDAPFSSLPDAAAHSYWFVPVRMLLRERYPSIERIGGVTCPLVIFHGDRDAVVPFALGRQLFDAAPEVSASGVGKVFVAIPGAGHNDLREVGSRVYYDTWRGMLRLSAERQP